jgi:uncharacterized RDD family membrane protein YckC
MFAGWGLATWSRQHEASPSSYAGLWFPFVAGIVDVLSASLIILAVARTVIDALGAAGYIRDTDRRLADFGTSSEQRRRFISHWLYSAAMESAPLQATVGKLMLRLRVTDAQGRRISFFRATLRYWGKTVSRGTP